MAKKEGTYDFIDGLQVNSSTVLTSVETGASDNDKLVTKGYVDDNASSITVSDTTSLDLTYSGNNISGVVLPAGVDHDSLNNYVADQHIDWTNTSENLSTSGTGGFSNVTSSNQATSNSHLVRLDQMNSALAGLSWQDSVQDQVDFTTAEPGTPSTGDRYINTVTGTSSGTSQSVTSKHIYEWNGTAWTDYSPSEGWSVWDQTADTNYTFNGSNWVEFGSTVSHNNTTGLQGGTSGEYYHLTSAEHTVVGNTSGINTGDQSASDFLHNSLSGVQGGQSGEYYHLKSAERWYLTQGANADNYHNHSMSAITDIASGAYSMSVHSTYNMTSYTAGYCKYIRIGKIVTVSGNIYLNPGSTSLAYVRVSLPIASDLSEASTGLTGCGTASDASVTCWIVGNTSYNKATIEVKGLNNGTVYFTFSYEIA